MTIENGRTVRLLGIAIAVLALILVVVCVVGGYFVSNQLTADTRPCKEQVSEFQDDLYVVVTLQSSAAELGADGKYSSALINAVKAEEMIKGITPPMCSIPAVDTYNHFKRAVVTYRQSLDAVNEGRFEDAILLQEEASSATRLATNSLERMLGE